MSFKMTTFDKSHAISYWSIRPTQSLASFPRQSDMLVDFFVPYPYSYTHLWWFWPENFRYRIKRVREDKFDARTPTKLYAYRCFTLLEQSSDGAASLYAYSAFFQNRQAIGEAIRVPAVTSLPVGLSICLSVCSSSVTQCYWEWEHSIDRKVLHCKYDLNILYHFRDIQHRIMACYWVRCYRSLVDISYTTFYQSAIVNIALSCIIIVLFDAE